MVAVATRSRRARGGRCLRLFSRHRRTRELSDGALITKSPGRATPVGAAPMNIGKKEAPIRVDRH